MSANTIILNGRRYDAVSGQLLGDTPKEQPSVAAKSRPAQPQAKAHQNHLAAHAPQKPAARPHPPVRHTATTSTGGQFMDFIRPTAKSLKHHQPVKSATLARHAVKKPPQSLKRHVSVQHRTDILAKQPKFEIQPKLSSYQLDPKRVRHAKEIPRSEHVSRYARSNNLLAAGAKPAPKSQARPLIGQPALAPVPVRDVPANQPSEQGSMDIFERAIANANSHAQAAPRKTKSRRRRGFFGKRALNIVGTAAAVVLVVGFFAWQEQATLKMKYAGYKSGVAASLPSYRPMGYHLGGLSYNPGMVAVNYRSANGEFNLIERSSNWDSQGLQQSFVAQRDPKYQTIDAAGRTIFTFGDNNATWVDNGVWYQINSAGSLSTDQLVNLAVSL